MGRGALWIRLVVVVSSFTILYVIWKHIYQESQTMRSTESDREPNIIFQDISHKHQQLADAYEDSPIEATVKSEQELKPVLSCVDGEVVRRSPKGPVQNFTVAQSVKQIESNEHRQQAFNTIYSKSEWANKTNDHQNIRSGPGSVDDRTKAIRNTLAHVLDLIKTKLKKPVLNMLDIPCGDFTWMSEFLAGREDIIYTGMDIVPKLINKLQKDYHQVENITFHVHDIASERLTDSYDFIFSRHMTQHLTDYDTLRTLYHFSESGSAYLLITTYPGALNNDLIYGMKYRFHPHNLELPPFSLKPPICQDYDGDRDVTALWHLPLQQITNCKVPKVDKYMTDTAERRVYTCS